MPDTLIRLRDDTASTAPVVPLAELGGDTNATAVRVTPGDDISALLPLLGRLELVEVAFPAYTDGRGYTSARALRERGYTGELRAVGDVLIDQISHYHRCGFDAFLPDQPIARAAIDKAIATWPEVYQRTVDGRAPIWAARHG
ncbi:DUF934 domain-containing protein [Novosphingobium sp.]|uniref:DUF934 domain-containing protein n=1 Tax=Novosphingobium sp. TaxID=1874826 RepID=UPI003B52E624